MLLQPTPGTKCNDACSIVCRLQIWNDYQLKWEQSKFDNIDVIRIQPDRVWQPDIVLFNKYVISKRLCIGVLFISGRPRLACSQGRSRLNWTRFRSSTADNTYVSITTGNACILWRVSFKYTEVLFGTQCSLQWPRTLSGAKKYPLSVTLPRTVSSWTCKSVHGGIAADEYERFAVR